MMHSADMAPSAHVTTPTHALTLIQPWAHAIEQLGKRIENRGWVPPRWVLGRRIYIHAGAKLDRSSVNTLRAFGHEIPTTLPQRSIGCSVVIVGWVQPNGRVGGAVTEQLVARVLSDAWYVPGQVAWVLDGLQLVSPRIEISGRLGLWEVTP